MSTKAQQYKPVAQPRKAAANGQARESAHIFPSLDFPGRTMLYPHECAKKLSASKDHILNLCKSGDLESTIVPGKKSVRSRTRVTIQGWRKFISDRTTGKQSTR